MSIIEKAIAQMETWAQDDSHGYDQANRWGPDYDCSSAVIQAWQNAGVPVKFKGATYTGNMYPVFKSCGFEDVTASVNLSNGSGLQRGDVLLNHVHHTAMYCGNGQIVQASINEFGTTTGGQTGDQTGREFYIRSYYNYPWDIVLRYNGSAGNITPSSPETPKPNRNIAISLPEIQNGDIDVSVAMLQAALKYKGYNPRWVDGEFGAQTGAALKAFQSDHGLDADAICGKATWSEITKA